MHWSQSPSISESAGVPTSVRAASDALAAARRAGLAAQSLGGADRLGGRHRLPLAHLPHPSTKEESDEPKPAATKATPMHCLRHWPGPLRSVRPV
jgi:hypothetical protein